MLTKLKIKAAVKLCAHTDPTMAVVRDFESKAWQARRQFLLKDSTRYAEELRMQLT